MSDPQRVDQFDQFYRDVRSRLLLLTYGLTGDLPSSRAAVRDAFVAAWHHWRKVARSHDPEAWVRERACRYALRRHTAKLWHREKGLDPDVKATLDALGKLTLLQRRVLLLTELSSASLTDLAREVGLSRPEAEHELQIATAQFSVHRSVPSSAARQVLAAMGTHLESSRLPRATIIRRAGATRRRTHTVIGVAATAAALVLAGIVVTDDDGVRPTLAGESIDASAGDPADAPLQVPEESLVDAETVAAVVPGRGWREISTGDNSTADGHAMTCQTERYAGRRTESTLVRSLDALPHDPTAPNVVQMTEAAPTTRAAHRAYEQSLEWFAACDEDRAQLMSTYDAPRVGDEAKVVVLRTWADPDRTVVAGVARSGRFSTSIVSTAAGDGGPEAADVAELLATSVNQLCELPDGGGCAPNPRVRQTTPVPVGDAPAMLSEVDLPPIDGVDKPWVGTEPSKAVENVAATGCDKTSFAGPGITGNLTRTFLVPGADLADQFGVTETVGAMPEKQARAMVAGVRAKLEQCSDKQMGTDVTQVRTATGPDRDLTVWRVTTEISDDRNVTYLMGIVRDGGAVGQVGFVPDGESTMPPETFDRLTERALVRLAQLRHARRG